MKRVFLLFIFVLTFNFANAETVKIGALLPLTGDVSSYGQALREGVLLSIQEHKNKYPNVEVIIDDIGSLEATTALKAAQRQANIHKVKAAVTMWIEDAQPIAPTLSSSNIPLLTAWDSNAQLVKLGKYVFSNGYSTELAGERAANFAWDTLKVKKVAALAHQDIWAETIRDSFVKKFKGRGGEIVFSDIAPIETDDYRSLIKRMMLFQPQAIFSPMVPPYIATYFRQLRELKITTPVITGDSINKVVLKTAGAAAEGVYFLDLINTSGSKLTDLYKDTFGHEPEEVRYVDLGYTAMNQIYKALLISEEKKISIRDSLEKIYGPSRSANREEKVFQVQSGEIVPLS